MGGYEVEHDGMVKIGDAHEHEMVAAAKLFASIEPRQPELPAQAVADDTPEYAAGEPVSLDERAENFHA